LEEEDSSSVSGEKVRRRICGTKRGNERRMKKIAQASMEPLPLPFALSTRHYLGE
jgi:hypothetical protein